MNQQNGGWWGSMPVVTKNIIIINVLMWLATIVMGKAGVNLINLLGLHFPGAKDFYLFQFITYMFLHDTSSIAHLFFNMFAVYMFGRILERVWGPKRFLFFYLVTGIGAGLVQEAVWYYELPGLLGRFGEITAYEKSLVLNYLITIGASGAVFGILLAFGMLFPDVPLYLMFVPIPIKAKYFVIFYGLAELFLGVASFSGTTGDNVAHFAHLGGMLFGFILIKYWKKKDADNGKYFY